MSVQRVWSKLAGHDLFTVTISANCGAQSAACLATIYSNALAEVQICGLPNPSLGRSRVWARNANMRRLASDARLLALTGDLRAASSSYIAPERLPQGIDVAVDLVAIGDTGAKRICEYEPRIAPPRFVAIGDLVFVSGNTDISAAFEQQLENICASIAVSLERANATWDDIVNVDVFFAKSLDWTQARHEVTRCFPVPPRFTTVEGYSAPEKLIEIEVTAKLARGR